MNVGIVTFQFAYNYGGVLQCLALQRTLEKLGVDTTVINYLPFGTNRPPIWSGWGIMSGTFLSSFKHKILLSTHMKSSRLMREKFDSFRSLHMKLSDSCNSNSDVEKIVRNCDSLIVGSDQVWRFSPYPMYFLEWGFPYKGTRISYAPCCGVSAQDATKAHDIKEWLSKFEHISVRNDFSKTIITKLYNKQIPVVADPTLLIDMDDVQKEVNLPYSEYILTYTLGPEISGGNRDALKSIQKRVGGLPVVAVIPSAHRPHYAPWADIVISDAGPAEWLSLIANANFVFTDSFHGALFSLKNKKHFFVYYADEQRSPRLLDLASRYAIQDCVGGSIHEASVKNWGMNHNNKQTNTLISEHAMMSIEYLKTSLGLTQ